MSTIAQDAAPPEALERVEARRILSRWVRTGDGHPGPPRPPRTQPWWRTRRPWAGVAAVSAIAVALAGWWLVRPQAGRAGAPATAAATRPASVAAPAADEVGATGIVLQASGFVTAARKATVSASVTGRIVKLFVTEGSRVHRGDPIAELDPDIPAAQVGLARAGVQAAERDNQVTQRKLAEARRTAKRLDTLVGRGYVSGASVDEARNAVAVLKAQLDAGRGQVAVARAQLRVAQQQMNDVWVRAPFDGVVTSLSAHEGEIVSPISGGGGFTRTGICTLLDESSLEGEVDVKEQYLARLHGGQHVQIKLPAYPGVVLAGEIAEMPVSIDRNTAAAQLRVRFLRRVPELRAGMRAEFAFQ